MAKAGFIHDKLDIKFLVLYLMARVASPVDFSTLADLTFCDDGVEYFDFAAALAELVDTGHLELKDDKYSITEKGRRNGKICESSLAYSVRRKCDRNLAKVNGVAPPGCPGPCRDPPQRRRGAHSAPDPGRRQGQHHDPGPAHRLRGAGRSPGGKIPHPPERLYDSILQVLLETEEEG